MLQAGFEALMRTLSEQARFHNSIRFQLDELDQTVGTGLLAKVTLRALQNYLNRRSTPFSTRIFAEISSTEKCVELMFGMFSRRNRFSTSRTSNSHWA